MRFRQWLNEIAEPVKPFGRLARSSVKKGAGWRERKVIQYRFKTSAGNIVKIHFDDIGEGVYDVMFYVNDTQYDDASKTEQSVRDPEIISGVLWTIRNKAEQLNANGLTFEAQKGDGDEKIVRNLDVKQFIPAALSALADIKQKIATHQVKMIPPNADLYHRLGRPVPPPSPDLDKDLWNKIISEFERKIASGELLEDNIGNLIYQSEKLQKVGIDPTELIKTMKDLSNALESNTKRGWYRRRNRREMLWDRLSKRYLSDKWEIEKRGVKFWLTRRQDSLS